MTDTLDRIEAIRRLGLKGRLVKGAEILGDYWRSGLRCKSGWRSICSCGPDESSFCRVKLKWVGMLLDFHQGHPYGLAGTEEYFVIEAMTLSMVQASGLTVLVDVPGAIKPIKFGGLPETWNLLPELEAMDEDSRSAFLMTVTMLQEAV